MILHNHYYHCVEFGYFRVGRISPNSILATIYTATDEKHVILIKTYEDIVTEISKDVFLNNCTERYKYRNYISWDSKMPKYL